jgi:hypothetical protein
MHSGFAQVKKRIDAVEALAVTGAFCAEWNERIHRLDATLQSFAPQTQYPYVFTPQAAENKRVLLPARRGVWQPPCAIT